ncbi:copper chaperone PCu(A)C [Pseudoglutamicibacter cumminsii]|uniref:Copper chaperone PCu(A)C n=1 Tax=Pseudoglutamicibacter cumminsii TaxID=156979 RepID=A0ABX5L760_9MICC|nr:copper chaperone PCu(A)C [Pseudoglutamicibacter cumminsii]PWI27497.1 hypothetical protein CAY35_06800 [Pseudoglutamicibacter cumminsii]
MNRRISAAIALSAAAVLGLSACSGDTKENTKQESSQEALTTKETWVKAASEGMTAAFGVIENKTDKDITIESASSEYAKKVELHEVIETPDGAKKMQEKEGGFVVPAHKSINLEPGADHLMFMGLEKEIKPGDTIKITLKTTDGDTFDFEAPAKEFTGANENYDGDMDHGDMDHGDHGDHGDHDHGDDHSDH